MKERTERGCEGMTRGEWEGLKGLYEVVTVVDVR